MAIEAVLARYGLVAILIGAGLEGETAVVTGGLLAHRGLFPVWAAAAAAFAGSFVVDQALFFLGRRYRDAPRIARLRARPAFARAMGLIERHPTGFILAFRFLYGLRIASPLAIGTAGVPVRRFVALNAIAAAVWAPLFTAIGFAGGDVLARLIPHGHPPLWLIGVVVLGLAAGLFVVHRLVVGRRSA